MSGRIYQNVVLQLKENTDRTLGVIDGEGIVIACSELSLIGQRWTEYVLVVNNAAGALLSYDGKTFKALNGWGNQFDYAAFAFGENDVSKAVCSVATVALNAAKAYYEEKHDRGSFIKDIISDNIMLGDIYMRAKELRVTADVARGVFVVRALKKGESVPTDVVQALFPDRQNDFVLNIGDGDVVLVRQMPEGAGFRELNKIIAQYSLTAPYITKIYLLNSNRQIMSQEVDYNDYELAANAKESENPVKISSLHQTGYIISVDHTAIGGEFRIIYGWDIHGMFVLSKGSPAGAYRNRIRIAGKEF